MNADGLVTDEQVDFAVEHAQRVSEGVQHEIHRNTWRYSVVIEQQRKALAERRERLLTTDVAADMLRRRSPEKAAEVDALDEPPADEVDADEAVDPAAEQDDSAVVAAEADLAEAGADVVAVEDAASAEAAGKSAGKSAEESNESDDESDDESEDESEKDDEGTLSRVGRSIALYQLDRLWAEHLAELSEVREGVHLRALGRLDPLDEFHRAAVPAFNALVPAVEERTVESFEEMEIGRGWRPDESALVRPTATWTYLVHDNPFGSELDRLIAAVGRRLSSGSR
jgi:preprotein translocase subunit SecA